MYFHASVHILFILSSHSYAHTYQSYHLICTLHQCPLFYSTLHNTTLFNTLHISLQYSSLIVLYFPPCISFTRSPILGWSTVGPPHKRKHLLYEQESKNNSSSNESVKTPGQLLEAIRTNVFHSSIFAKYLNM